MKLNRSAMALLTCCTVFAGCMHTIPTLCSAADRVIMPLYTPDQETTSSLSLTVHAGTTFSMAIVQHSEERETLEMYTAADTPAEDTTYHCITLEPGDYTLEVSVPAISGCKRQLTQALNFTIASPDYVTDYSASTIEVTLIQTIDDTQEIAFADAELITYIEDNTQYLRTDFICNGAAGLCGDVDLNGTVTTQDALITLQAYIQSLIGTPTTLTMQQEICADIDGDGMLGANDALSILQYYTQGIMGQTPSWDT